MLKPECIFSVGNLLAMLAWLVLAVGLFGPARLQPPIWIGTTIVVPVLLGIAYAGLLASAMRAGTGGGFTSIAAVRRLFANDAALAAGWLHYLAFDLFVGSWIARAGVAAAMSPFLLLPCLLLTFMVGPVGLVAFLVLRLVIAPEAAFAM